MDKQKITINKIENYKNQPDYLEMLFDIVHKK
jgi:protoheme ferro-lyase